MRKFLQIFMCWFVGIVVMPADAVTINKAAPVAPVESSSSSTTASLVPTVLGIISGVQQLTNQQRQLTAECIPTSQEINWVNNMVKEWAKTGAMNAADVERKLSAQGMRRCASATGGYANSVAVAANTDMENAICYDYFGTDADRAMVWYQFPMASVATYCSDGSLVGCATDDRVTVSNIYEIFNLIDFSMDDYYGANDATMWTNLINKIEKCSDVKLSARKRQLWGEFLTDTINSLGQPTNTGSIMDAVSGITSGGGLGSMSIGSLAAQFLGN